MEINFKGRGFVGGKILSKSDASWKSISLEACKGWAKWCLDAGVACFLRDPHELHYNFSKVP